MHPVAPSISFLTAAYNAEKTLPATIGSLQAQTRSDWEVVVVDDGSSDGTLEAARAFAEGDPRVVVLSKSNGGAASARNLAASVARGRWWCALDADDELAPRFVEGMLSFAEYHPGYEIYSCLGEMRFEDGTTALFDESAESQRVTSFSLDQMINRNRISATALIEPALFRALDGYRDMYCEDYDLWLRAFLLGAKHLHDPEVLFVYHVKATGKNAARCITSECMAEILAEVAEAPQVPAAAAARAKRMAAYYRQTCERLALEERLRRGERAGARHAYWKARDAYLSRAKWAVGVAVMLASPSLFARLLLGEGESGGPEAGFNVFGYLTSNLGLGVAARNTTAMLLGAGYKVRLTDVDPRGGMQGRDSTFAEQIVASRQMEPLAVNLFHINPDQAIYLLDPLQCDVTLEGRLNACVPFWELPRLPDSWIAPLAAMDVILAPTCYVRDAILAALPDADVIHYPQAVHVPDGIVGDRVHFGLPAGVTIFVSSFDLRSDIERKNPFGAIEAFERAFADGRDDVRLVIKANNVDTVAGLSRHLERLREYAASDARVIILSESMRYADVLALYASCDVLVSLHRAEGLGLSLLEAMSLGVPVVATGWSGNMDFCTAENSCLVGYDMVPVKASSQPAYASRMAGEQVWAEPRLDEAAQWFRRLAEEPELRQRIGEAARRSAAEIRAEYDRAAVAEQVLARLTGLDSPVHREKASRMRRLRRWWWLYMARRYRRAALIRLRNRLGRS